jgi:arsenate reductase (thioredoxin)
VEGNALFVCRQNAGRSQMAAALYETASNGRYAARSAGRTPADQIHPVVVEAMRELGIDISRRSPQPLQLRDIPWANLVVTMGCDRACFYLPGKRLVEWEIDDPGGKPIGEVRIIRDEIARLVDTLIANVDAGIPVGELV